MKIIKWHCNPYERKSFTVFNAFLNKKPPHCPAQVIFPSLRTPPEVKADFLNLTHKALPRSQPHQVLMPETHPTPITSVSGSEGTAPTGFKDTLRPDDSNRQQSLRTKALAPCLTPEAVLTPQASPASRPLHYPPPTSFVYIVLSTRVDLASLKFHLLLLSVGILSPRGQFPSQPPLHSRTNTWLGCPSQKVCPFTC